MMHKSLPGKSPRSIPKERKSDDRPAQPSERRKAGASRKDDSESVAIASDQDQTVQDKKGHKHRRSQSDANTTLEGETLQRRRRLMTGKDYRRNRKDSAASAPSPDEESEIEVKRESQPPGLKRMRSSASPAPGQTRDAEARLHVKKRRTVLESSPEETRPHTKRKPSRVDQIKDVEMKDAESRVLSDIDEVFRQHRQASVESAKSRSKPASESGEAQPSDLFVPQAVTGAESAEKAVTASESLLSPTEEANIDTQMAEVEQQKEEDRAKMAEAARKAEEDKIAAAKVAEERRIAEEIEAKRKAEEEAIARKKEEEERQELVRREHEQRILEDTKRRQEEQIRQQHLEIERRRRESLPAALCKSALMLDNNDPAYKTPDWLRRFLPLYVVKTKQLEPNTPPALAEEEWVPNFQVACLLATKDLKLANFTSFDKRPVTNEERDRLWKVGRQMLSYDYQTNGFNTPIKQAIQIEEQQRPKFFNMTDLFWVKVTDFEDQISRHPHLLGINLRKQPISLRFGGLGSLSSSAPQANGVHIHEPKVNGFSPYMTTPCIVNGGPR